MLPARTRSNVPPSERSSSKYSDSDSELPNIGFSHLTARSQRTRESAQGKAAVNRDSRLVKPEARRVERDEAEGEAEPEIDLALVDEHGDPNHQATIESDGGEPDSFTISNIRDDSPPLAQSSDPRPASCTSDTRETFGDAEPSDVHGRAITPVRSLSAQPFLVEDVATSSPTVGAVETYVTNPDHLRSTGGTRDNIGDTGSVRTTSVASASISSHTLPGPDEALVTNCSTAHTTNPIPLDVTEGAAVEPAVEPVVSAQPTSNQHERLDVGPVLSVQRQENDVEIQQQCSEQSHKELGDMDAVMLFVERASNNIWHQLSEKYPQHTANQWRRLYLNKVLPDFDAKRVTASLATRELDQLPSGECSQSNHNVQSPQGENHAVINVADRRPETCPIVCTSETQNVALPNATLPPSGAIQGQPSHPRAYIQGSMRFTNCGQVNIASDLSQSEGTSTPENGLLFAPTLIVGDLVFEGCESVNILTLPDPVISVQKRQRRSHRPTRRPEKPTRSRPQPQQQSQSPRVHQYQAPSQHPPPAPPMVQPSQPEAPLRTFAQPYPPTQLPPQPQSYGPTL